MHANDVITSLERDVFPRLGAMPPAEIDKPLLLSLLREVEKRGAIETARRINLLKAGKSSLLIVASGR